MHHNVALVVSSALSLVAGCLAAAIGDEIAQYGFALLLVAAPFYVAIVASVLAACDFAFAPLIKRSKAWLLLPGFTVSLLAAAWIILSGLGLSAALAIATSLLSAFAFFCLLRSPRPALSPGQDAASL
jgi:hypothetical protein